MSDESDELIEQVLSDAIEAGLNAEALRNVCTTALTLFTLTDFGEWRAACDARGWTSGPRSEEIFRLHATVLARVVEDLD